MRKITILVAVVFNIFFFNEAFASSTWTGWSQVNAININQGVAFVQFDPVSGHINPFGCTVPYWYALDSDDPDRKHYITLLATAKASGGKARVYITGCQGGYPKVNGVMMD